MQVSEMLVLFAASTNTLQRHDAARSSVSVPWPVHTRAVPDPTLKAGLFTKTLFVHCFRVSGFGLQLLLTFHLATPCVRAILSTTDPQDRFGVEHGHMVSAGKQLVCSFTVSMPSMPSTTH